MCQLANPVTDWARGRRKGLPRGWLERNDVTNKSLTRLKRTRVPPLWEDHLTKRSQRVVMTFKRSGKQALLTPVLSASVLYNNCNTWREEANHHFDLDQGGKNEDMHHIVVTEYVRLSNERFQRRQYHALWGFVRHQKALRRSSGHSNNQVYERWHGKKRKVGKICLGACSPGKGSTSSRKGQSARSSAPREIELGRD